LKKYFAISSAQAVVCFILFLIFIFYNHEKRKSVEAGVTFQDVTARAGIRFVHNNGAFGKKVLAGDSGSRKSRLSTTTTMDGRTFSWSTARTGRGTDKNTLRQSFITTITTETFTDVYAQRRASTSKCSVSGVAVGDYDNDGYDDLFVTAYGQSHLFHNNGNGTFTDFTQKSRTGAESKEFSTSAAWVDYDKRWQARSRRLAITFNGRRRPIFIAPWTARANRIARPNRTRERRCGLWHNNGRDSNGNVTFSDVTQKGRTWRNQLPRRWEVAVLDYDNDGWPDFAFFSNDTQPNKLYRNNGNGTFTEKSRRRGVWRSARTAWRVREMGVDTADYDRTGNTSLMITNFSNQMISLYHNEGKGLFC